MEWLTDRTLSLHLQLACVTELWGLSLFAGQFIVRIVTTAEIVYAYHRSSNIRGSISINNVAVEGAAQQQQW